MSRLSNAQAIAAIENRVPFTSNTGSLYGKWWSPEIYAVYSYGVHFPLAAYNTGTDTWAVNWDKSNRTTGRHKRIVRKALRDVFIYALVSTSDLRNVLG